MKRRAKVLVVDDEAIVRESLCDWLSDIGHQVLIAENGPHALKIIQKEEPSIVIADLVMPGMDGIELLKRVKEISPRTEVIVVTAYGSIPTAITAMREGAYDYIEKPFCPERAELLIEKLVEHQQLLEENITLQHKLEERYRFENIIAKSPRMQQVIEIIKVVARGQFREDLYYRLNVANIELPPLRERKEDILLLAQHFLKKFALENSKEVTGFSPKAIDFLLKYDWPCNVREMENTIERAVILAQNPVIEATDLPQSELVSAGSTPAERNLKQVEKGYPEYQDSLLFWQENCASKSRGNSNKKTSNPWESTNNRRRQSNEANISSRRRSGDEGIIARLAQ
jgi:DNA-binding NtrC family response regulator